MRFKSLGGSTEQLVAVYTSRIRSILEFAAPVFHSGLTVNQSAKIEHIQKKALAIILAADYNDYEHALAVTNLQRLDSRRTEISLSFAQKCVKSSKHRSMFPLNPVLRPNMRNAKWYLEPYCTTSRYFNSPIPYLTRLLNGNLERSP